MASLESLVNVSHADQVFRDTWTSSEASLYATYFVTVSLFFLLVYIQRESYPELPRLNPKKATELTWSARLLDFMQRSPELLTQGIRQFKGQPYKLFTDMGDVIVVPGKYAEELKSRRELDVGIVARDAAHSYIPGLTPFHSEEGFTYVIQNYLTKALASLTGPISQEASKGIRDTFPQSQEWAEITPDDIRLLVTRMSSRIFMGEELCNDEEWNRVSVQYVSAAFYGVSELSKWPRPMRRWVHWFMPCLIETRRQLKSCRAVLQPYVDRRIAVKKAAAARGEPNPYNDSIEWFSRELRPDHDPTKVQLTMTLAAVHTTSDLLCQTMVDIAKHPEIISPLRKEVIRVLKTDGLKRSAFQKLHLMDACFKESQRLRPLFLVAFRRVAQADVTLKDGFVIKKGTKITMDGRTVMLNEDNYQDPLQWNPYRFIQMREAGEENRAHLVSTTAKHIGFGHGVHACPGRFFAANELKIALAHILLKYDWKLPEGVEALPPLVMGSAYVLAPGTKFSVIRRQEEIDIDSLEC
ncbi:cytochrome P450 [Colletotrichum zoysiae]|uniref:Cytochrome P450 n=1 Tax=Colletotrichum zoysiae TaxID=1216348 RepID=A0AAD9HBM9_9PEZI|nr:cytochrome P450 [Colletotrichum zoysiae]